MHLNKVLLYGNLTKDPELKSTPSGTSVCSFSIGTNRKWKSKDGKEQEDAQFHNCVAWGKTAELICQFMHKGSGIMIEGRLQTRNYEAKDKTKRYVTEVVVENMQFGPKSGQGRAPAADQEEIQADGTPETPSLDDIPF